MWVVTPDSFELAVPRLPGVPGHRRRPHHAVARRRDQWSASSARRRLSRHRGPARERPKRSTNIRSIGGPAGYHGPSGGHASNTILIRGAREHNLRNVDLELPRDKLIVFTGLSGSGKSSLAFDTIYAEGQRRYVESLSAYARQFLGQMDKPDVDFIEGLSPAISIDQKSASRNPRSTVGTITEIYDYLRLLYARIGVAALPELRPGDHPPDAAADRRPRARSCQEGTRFQVLAPVVRGPQGRVRGAAQGARARRASPAPGSTASWSSSASRQRAPRPLREPHHRGRRRPPGAACRASSAGSPTRSRPRCASPRASPRSRSCPRGRRRRPTSRR